MFLVLSFIVLLFVLLGIFLILRKYAMKDIPKVAYLFTYLGYSLGFLTIFLIPIDIANKNENLFEFQIIWTILYWSTYLMCFCILPLLVCYFEAPEFTQIGKIKYSLKINLLWYLAYAFILFIYIGYNTVEEENLDLFGFLIALGNTFGLFFIIFFIANGVVSVPRLFWDNRNLSVKYKNLVSKFFCIHQILEDAKYSIEEYVKEVNFISSHSEGELQEYCQKALENVPFKIKNKILKGKGQLIEENSLTLERLTRINYSLQNLVHSYKANLGLYKKMIPEIIIEYKILSLNQEKEILTIPEINKEEIQQISPISKSRIIWEEKISPFFSKILFAIFSTFGLILIVSEVSLSFPDINYISLFYLLELIDFNPLIKIILTGIPIILLCIIVYYGIFSFKFTGFYALYPNKETDHSHLLWSALNICRFASPLIYNYLFLWHINYTSFEVVLGNVKNIPLFGVYFPKYFPLVLFFLSFINFFRLFDKFMIYLGIDFFSFSEAYTKSNYNNGNALIIKEISKIITKINRKNEIIHNIHSKADNINGEKV